MVQFCWRDEFAAFQISVVRTWEQMWEDFLFHMGTYFIMWAPVSSPVSLSHTHTSSPVLLVVKNIPANAVDAKRCKFDPWAGKILWRSVWQPTLTFLPGESHGQRSLVGHSPWGRKGLDTTEQLTHTHTHTHTHTPFIPHLALLHSVHLYNNLLQIAHFFSTIP